MPATLKSSKLISVMTVLVAVALILSYSVMSGSKSDNTVYYAELAIYTLVGIAFSFGICLAIKGKKNIAILAGCFSLVLLIFIIPCLTAGYPNVPYLLQVFLYAKRTMTMLCPFLAAWLLKWLCSITEGRRHGTVLAGFGYFAIAFVVTALLQGAVKWQYSYWYGYDTTWNAAETFYWALTINAVYIRRIQRNTADTANESCKRDDRGLRLIYALIADLAAVLLVIWKSDHIRSILQDFAVKLTESGPIYALRNCTWLSYRVEIFKGIINGEYSVGESIFLEAFPNEFPIHVLWTSEPLASARLTYGWPGMLTLLVIFVVFLVLLYAIRRREQTNDESGVWIRYSFTALCCLSFMSHMFVPTYGLIMPLMGDGACMIALLVVYLALWG